MSVSSCSLRIILPGPGILLELIQDSAPVASYRKPSWISLDPATPTTPDFPLALAHSIGAQAGCYFPASPQTQESSYCYFLFATGPVLCLAHSLRWVQCSGKWPPFLFSSFHPFLSSSSPALPGSFQNIALLCLQSTTRLPWKTWHIWRVTCKMKFCGSTAWTSSVSKAPSTPFSQPIYFLWLILMTLLRATLYLIIFFFLFCQACSLVKDA